MRALDAPEPPAPVARFTPPAIRRALPTSPATRSFPVWTAPAIRGLEDPRRLVAALEKRGERDVAARLERLGVEKLARFPSAELLLEIMRNRETDGASDPRRRALLVFPKFDETRAFERTAMRDLRANNHRVLYYEARSDAEFTAILEAETIAAEQTGAPIDFLEIAGHGAARALAFDNHPDRKQPDGLPPDEDILDWSDIDALLEARLGGLMKPGGVIQLNSCSTGYGRESFPNIANLLAEIFPDQHIHAPTVPAESTPRFRRDGTFISPGYRLGDPTHTYHVAPHVPRTARSD